MLDCEIDLEQSGFPDVTTMAIPEDQAYLYGCFPTECCDGEGLEATPLDVPDFHDLLASAASNPTINFRVNEDTKEENTQPTLRRQGKRRREPEQTFLTNIKKFVRSGSTATHEDAYEIQQQTERTLADVSYPDRFQHEESGAPLGSNLQRRCSVKGMCMSGDACIRCPAPNTTTQKCSQSAKVDVHSAGECGSQTDIVLPSCVLEKIKEGMAQLLAEYTWPWIV